MLHTGRKAEPPQLRIVVRENHNLNLSEIPPLLFQMLIWTSLGCGRLRNLSIFRRFFSEIALVDTKLQCNRIADQVPRASAIRLLPIEEFAREKRKYDAVFIISVLHIIPRLS